jgi:hypothetical protein
VSLLDLKEMFSFPSFIWTFEKKWVKRSKANCLLMEMELGRIINSRGEYSGYELLMGWDGN